MEHQKLEWEAVETEHLVQDEWIDFRKVKYRFPDGSEFGPYYNFSRKDYVVIVARDEDGRFLCVRQFRHGISKVTVEFPAGAIEDGNDCDAAMAAAKRELKEETGYVSDSWRHLITIPDNATLADNYAHVYYADHCRKTDSLKLDETEFLEPVMHDAEEIEKMIEDGLFAQSIHVMAYLMVK